MLYINDCHTLHKVSVPESIKKSCNTGNTPQSIMGFCISYCNLSLSEQSHTAQQQNTAGTCLNVSGFHPDESINHIKSDCANNGCFKMLACSHYSLSGS